jgi:hypothetical protein
VDRQCHVNPTQEPQQGDGVLRAELPTLRREKVYSFFTKAFREQQSAVFGEKLGFQKSTNGTTA